jgi:MATE family multidrug resistance protein
MSLTNTTNIQAFLHESKNLLKLAFPIFIGAFCNSCLGLIDTLMASDIGTVDLAAVALGSTIWMPFCLFCFGIPYVLAPISAHLHGAKRENEIAKTVYNSLFPSIFFTILAMLILIYLPKYILGHVEIELALKTCDYLFYMALGLPGTVLFHILKNTSEGVSYASPSMIIGIICLILNIPVNYIFIYGEFGAPKMGAVGCGIATTFVNWLSFFIMIVYIKKSAKLKDLKIFSKLEKIDLSQIIYVCKIGLPISFSFIIEVLTFCILGYGATPFGTEAVAAHQIANIVAIITFMVPMSMCGALAIRVGNSLGEGSYPRTKRAIISCLSLSFIFIIPIAIGVFACKEHIIHIFSYDPKVTQIATSLFIFILIWQLQDSFFGTATGILRGFKDTKALMYVNLVAFWIFGIPAGYLIGHTDYIFSKPQEIIGMWGTITTCYVVITIVLWIRSFNLLKNRHKYLNKPSEQN